MKVLGIAGWSGSGKTTLMTRLVANLVMKGLSVSTIKHAHKDFNIDQPGKDSHKHREAGAQEVLVGSRSRWALIHELRGSSEPSLGELLEKISPVDLVLVEGFKFESHPKIEVYRSGHGGAPLYPDDPRVIAVVSDLPLLKVDRPVFHLDDIHSISRFVSIECSLPVNSDDPA